jgi:hypothetical protein
MIGWRAVGAGGSCCRDRARPSIRRADNVHYVNHKLYYSQFVRITYLAQHRPTPASELRRLSSRTSVAAPFPPVPVQSGCTGAGPPR